MWDIRLIALDMDGTVLDDAKNISPHTMDVLLRAIARGVEVVPATGRTVDGVPPQFMALPGLRYALGCNGAQVVELATGRTLVHLPFEAETALQIYDIVSRFDCMLSVFIGGKACTRAEDAALTERYTPANLRAYLRNFRQVVTDLPALMREHADSIEKFSIMYRDVAVRDAARAAVLARFPEVEATSSLGDNLELNAPGVDKGRGLLALAEVLGLCREQVMACGDGGNDLAMIRAAGLGVAMANAQDEVKAAAKYITLSNNDDGVAAAVEKFVLNI